MARLGREVVVYTLTPTTSKSQSPSHAAIVSLNHLNASSPIAHLRGTTPMPSSSSLTIASDGVNTLLIHADSSRPLIHVHNHQIGSTTSTCPLAARLHPPEATNTLALSPSGNLLAAGSTSGRIYVWYIPSGNLVASFDAHFREITCLEWTSCETGLVSASQDARILVWSVTALVDDANSNPTPYAIFSDHVQPITSIQMSSSSKSSISSFPCSARVLSSSTDGTVKLWDVRSRSLVATWAFLGPINHLVVDVGFRAFFVALRASVDVEADQADGKEMEDRQVLKEWDSIRRVDLYGSNAEESVSATSSLTRAKGKEVWKPRDTSTRITAMTLSMTGSHLLLGTSEAQLHIVDVASSLMIRSATLVPAGNPSTNLSVSNLETFLLQDANSSLSGNMRKPGNSSNGEWEICEKLQRMRGEETAFAMRLPVGRADQIASLLTPPSLRAQSKYSSVEHEQRAASTSAKDGDQLQVAQRQIAKLEADNEKLNDLLRRAQKTNAGLWERVVNETVKGGKAD
ncbi:hypothetical protein CBS101457_003972 [Exobasidium rhododendri]|nr:hypothetical protein CBS101457_003972 [Exobasidium rhododendri]